MNSRRVAEAVERVKNRLLSMSEQELQDALLRHRDSAFSVTLLESGVFEFRESELPSIDEGFVRVPGTRIEHDIERDRVLVRVSNAYSEAQWSVIKMTHGQEKVEKGDLLDNSIDELYLWAA